MDTYTQELLNHIRALTHNPSYSIESFDGKGQLGCTRGDEIRVASPMLTPDGMEQWLEAYIAGLQDGYITAKRGY